MVPMELEVKADGDLVVPKAVLREAGLNIGRGLKLIIQKGEIRIHPESSPDPEKVLEELAGCLGQELATDYNFSLKIGHLYEAR